MGWDGMDTIFTGEGWKGGRIGDNEDPVIVFACGEWEWEWGLWFGLRGW